MSQLPHIFYPSPGDEESYCLGCRKFASSKSAQEEWEKETRHLEMMNRGREFIGEEFTRLLQDWYWPTEGLAPAEVQVYGGDACLVIGKVLEEFALMQAKYKLLTNPSPLLENDNSSKPVPGYGPGHTMGTGDQESHTYPIEESTWEPLSNLINAKQAIIQYLDKKDTKEGLLGEEGDGVRIDNFPPLKTLALKPCWLPVLRTKGPAAHVFLGSSPPS
ncbi:hypothetical protein DSO57_1019258 [Entomophthora muscae]|uniref:Uncharacterized protein n=1 Tax=Entomophthora muscae TaxID=34485 RepID=A0ACC2UPF7_9FUNG|nr:hypothetical protein DSO57_1019258 [Entomophthora muscae]